MEAGVRGRVGDGVRVGGVALKYLMGAGGGG